MVKKSVRFFEPVGTLDAIGSNLGFLL